MMVMSPESAASKRFSAIFVLWDESGWQLNFNLDPSVRSLMRLATDTNYGMHTTKRSWTITKRGKVVRSQGTALPEGNIADIEDN